MKFTWKNWEHFCVRLAKNGLISIPAKEVSEVDNSYVVLKHDVETDVKKAYQIACIEEKYCHKGSFYVQAYLLDNPQNVELLRQISNMGHEVSYHYDVLDSNKGNIPKALEEFESNKKIFESLGFEIKTVCQHGNPVIERIGYASNRDFFRDSEIKKIYPKISDIMVDFKQKHNTNYLYFSDAGRRFNLIFDPINNDIEKNDDKNIPYNSLDELFGALSSDMGNIISIHPHRWTKSALNYEIKTVVFKLICSVARLLTKVPIAKKIMSKYYYLAKKI